MPTIEPVDPALTRSGEPVSDETYIPGGVDSTIDRRFVDFPLSSEVLKGVVDLGYATVTPVQAVAIEPALAGRDLLVHAGTGAGKIAAFAIPMIERATPGSRATGALVLAPTRLLAQHIGEKFSAIAKYRDINLCILAGGLAMGPQEQQLARGCEIVIGTPDRVLEHLRKGTLSLSHVGMLCLDEADEMLSMGLYEDVTAIIDASAPGRQISVFSATLPDDLLRLTETYLRDPEDLRPSSETSDVPPVEHVLYEMDLREAAALLSVLDMYDPPSAILFCNTREEATAIASLLDRQGLDVLLLSGELPAARRVAVMKRVKEGVVRYIVSTDLAARGLDLSDLSHVIHCGLPAEPSVYVNRIGRTRKAVSLRAVISLVGSFEHETRRALETRHQIRFVERVFPDPSRGIAGRVDRQMRQLRDSVGSLVFESYLPAVRALKDSPDGEVLLAAALRAFFQWDRQRRASISEADTASESVVRSERPERKGKRAERKDKDRERGDRRRRPKAQGATEEIDALLVIGAPVVIEASAAEGSTDSRKKKRRRRKKAKGAFPSASSPAGTDDAADEPNELVVFDDLDALLSSD